MKKAKRAATQNRTGLPDKLKAGIESLSGISMDQVKVHYSSSPPAQLNARAYAQGSEIHLAPGKEKHLPHEAWHVVQQAQGRVRPTAQRKTEMPVNDSPRLEREADAMGAKAMNSLHAQPSAARSHPLSSAPGNSMKKPGAPKTTNVTPAKAKARKRAKPISPHELLSLIEVAAQQDHLDPYDCAALIQALAASIQRQCPPPVGMTRGHGG